MNTNPHPADLIAASGFRCECCRSRITDANAARRSDLPLCLECEEDHYSNE